MGSLRECASAVLNRRALLREPKSLIAKIQQCRAVGAERSSRWGRAWGGASHPSSATSANIRTMPTGYSPRCRSRVRCRASLRTASRRGRGRDASFSNERQVIAFLKHYPDEFREGDPHSRSTILMGTPRPSRWPFVCGNVRLRPNPVIPKKTLSFARRVAS